MKVVTLIAMSMALFACTSKQGRTGEASINDGPLQSKVESIMESKLKEFGAQSGQVMVADVKTGQVIASWGKAPATPYRSGLVCLASLSAALETGKVHLDDTIDTENGVCIAGSDTLFDHNWRSGGYGKLTVKQAFVRNSTIGIYKAAVKAFGDNTEEYLGEVRQLYDTSSLVVFANHGEWATVSPMLTLALVNKIAANAGNDSLKSVMRYTVTNGQGKPADTDKVEIAAVVGTTAQEDSSYWAEFCGYFPYDNPQYSMIVAIHKMEMPASGGAMAGSVFKAIAEYMFAR